MGRESTGYIVLSATSLICVDLYDPVEQIKLTRTQFNADHRGVKRVQIPAPAVHRIVGEWSTIIQQEHSVAIDGKITLRPLIPSVKQDLHPSSICIQLPLRLPPNANTNPPARTFFFYLKASRLDNRPLWQQQQLPMSGECDNLVLVVCFTVTLTIARN